MKDAMAEKDLDKRAAILHEAEQIIIEDMVVVPLYFNQSFYISRELSNIEVNEYGVPTMTKMKQKNYKKYLPVETNQAETAE